MGVCGSWVHATSHQPCFWGNGFIGSVLVHGKQAKATAPENSTPPPGDQRPIHWVELSKQGDSWLQCRDGSWPAFRFIGVAQHVTHVA